MKISKSQTATAAGGFIPEGLYRVRCLGTKFDTRSSQGKSPMTTLNCEIIEPEKVEVNGREVVVAGRKFNLVLVHDVEKTGWASHEQCLEFCDKLGVELNNDENGEPEYDTDLHEEYFKGLEWDMPLKSAETFKTYGAAVGDKKRGDFILDGEGNKISTGMQINGNPSDVPGNCRPSRNEAIANAAY